MSDHDLRRQSREIREALEHHDRDQLINILVHVFSHFVMQGGDPAPRRSAEPAAGDELAGLSFVRLIERLQLRLDLPELQLFEVHDGKVSVRAGGRLVPLDAPTRPREALPLPASGAAPGAYAMSVSLAAAPVSSGPSGAAGPAGAAASSGAAGPASSGAAGPSGAASPSGTSPPSSSRPSSPASVPSSSAAPGAGVAPTPAGLVGHAGAQRPEASARQGSAAAPQRVTVNPRPAAAAATPPAQPAREERPAEEGGGRFSMLEID